MLVLALALSGCTITTNDDREKHTVDDMTVDWDVSEATKLQALGSPVADGELVRQTPGEDGLEVRVDLPGGDVVTGRWSRAIATVGDDGLTVGSIELTTSADEDEDTWRGRIDDFVSAFGGDRGEIDAYLSEVIPKVERGGGDTGRSFAGTDAAGYEPELEILPRGGGDEPVGVVVDWTFTLTS